MLARIRDYGDRFFVVLRQSASQLGPSIGPEFHSFSDSKIKHLAVRPHLAQKSESSYNFVIQFNQFCFGEGIDIEFAHGRLCPRQRAHFCISRPPLATLQFIHRPALTKVRIPDIV
jgi:hypothetical protein